VRYEAGMLGQRLRVSAISIAPVKGLRVARVPRAIVEPDGLRGDRRLYLIDTRGRLVNGKHYGGLHQVRSVIGEDEELELSFPGGVRVSGPLLLGPELQARFYSRSRQVREVDGPFAQALSAHVGAPLRLVAAADGSSSIDRAGEGAVSLVSSASLAALAALAGREELDPRRFRMGIEISGSEPFEEDEWIGRRVRVGGATIRPAGNIGRCIVTSRDPDTGEVDVPTLDLLRELRGEHADTTEPLAMGIHAAVLVPGPVAVGDAVEIVDTRAHADRAGRG